MARGNNKEGRRAVVNLRLSERATQVIRKYSEDNNQNLPQAVSEYIERAIDTEMSDLDALRDEIVLLKGEVGKRDDRINALSRELSALKEQATTGGGTFLVPHRR